MPAVFDRPFFLYISAISHALAALLARCDDEDRERAVYYKSIKGQVIAEQLVDAPSSKSFPTLDLLPNEDVLIVDQNPVWDLYFDGSRCQTGFDTGVVFVLPEGKLIPLSFRLEFHSSNNIAEYEALIARLRATIAMGVKHIRIHGDSELIVNQVTGAYRVKQLKLSQYKDLVLTILKQFTTHTINSIPWRENRHANAMASATSLVGPDFGQDEYHFVTGSFPEDTSKSSRVRIRKLATRYILLSDILYRRSYNGLLLRCLTKAEIPVALQEAQSGSGGGHFGGKSLVYKLIHMGYYWQTMEQDSFTFVKKCPQCQQHSNLIRAPAQLLRSQVSPWPFQTWGLDIIDKISPPSSKGHIFIITATNYFTKWVEAVPLRSTTAGMICGFITDNIISRFGIPTTLISDNGTMPYNLMYGVDAITPLELEIPSLRISLKGVIDDDSYRTLRLNIDDDSYCTLRLNIDDDSYCTLRLNQLELSDERRLKTLQHLQAYQKSQSRQYNQSVLPRTFQIGDLVLYENQRNVNAPPDQREKFSPN
ncbi:uncharacterized protein LOC131856610 [Cryptomeria japonica]|uniref:uncharacterized protein LOC131856610 n=1 Tax=Cryptomeria japonica TaxID=3369 RepID=UPI0027DA68A5|nr:uncharacterized protein LOC131856610 [Cryptomeria japonica]